MMNLEELRANRSIVNEIDWAMTPEKAIEMYLEWGTGWIRGNDFVSHHNQESIYFVLFDWEGPKVTGNRPGVGVHPLNRELKEWVQEAIDGPSIMHNAVGMETVSQNITV